MKNREDALIRKMIDYCKEAEDAIKLFKADELILQQNPIFRNAACMPIMQIGELCKLVSDEFRSVHSQIDWRGWCGVRDIMAHQYTELDNKKTWQVLSVDLPALKDQLSVILKQLDEDAIERIKEIIDKNEIKNISEYDAFHRIVDGTGISINAFSDEKLLEFLKTISK